MPFRRPTGVRIAASILPCVVLLVALASPGTPLLARILIVAMAGVTVWNPAAGLIAAAGLAPLGVFVAALDGIAGFRLTEAILLSFITAWLLRPPPAGNEGPRLPRYASCAAWLFSVLIVSLAVGLNTQLLRYPDALRTNLMTVAQFYFKYADPTGISDCAQALEGVALVVAAMELFRRRPALANALPVALALSASAAALASVLLWFGVGPQLVLARRALIGSERLSAHVGDVNAAGSYFVLILCLALGMSAREHGRRRAFWLAASAACGIGLWMTRSRSAEAAAAVAIAAAALWATTAAWPRARRARLIGGVLGALLILVAVFAWQLDRDPNYSALGLRGQFAMSSFRMIGTHPWFGIGVGRYYRDSPAFLTPQLAWLYGSENAHNNLLQLTTETGLLGFLLFACWVVGALRQGIVALSMDPRDWRLLGATMGIVAFAGTCLMGHPLLLPEVATAFFVVLALVASLGGSRLPIPATPAAFWPATAVAGTLVLMFVPALTVLKPLVPVHLEEVDGFYYGSDGAAEGVPFRWARKYSSLYAPAAARVVDIPLRAPMSAVTKEPVAVEITFGGVRPARTLVGDTWSTVRITLPSPDPLLSFKRINLMTDQAARLSQFVPGSTDEREVGIQVGDIRIVRVAWEFVPRRDGDRRP